MAPDMQKCGMSRLFASVRTACALGFNSRPLRVRRQTIPKLLQKSGILHNWHCYDRKNIQLFSIEETERLFRSFMITATDGAIKF